MESELHAVTFPERHSDWDIVDSRGLFESVTPDGDLPADTIQFMKDDIDEYRPDILLHVMTPDQVRGGEDDFEVLQDLKKELGDMLPPIVFVVNKVDSHMTPGDEWPPENNPQLSNFIQRKLDQTSDIVSKVVSDDDFDHKQFDKENPLKGYQFDSEKFVGVVPVYAKEEPFWNINTLSWFIGDFLPEDARLQFFQAQERASIMRNVAKDVRKTFSISAATIGGVPSPYSDTVPITALQYVQIALIAGFSCRSPNIGNVKEFVASLGLLTGAAITLRKLARGMIQLVPVGGQVVSAGVAGAGTYAMGKSAEKYFFDDVVEEPKHFMQKGKEIYSENDN